MCEKPTKKPIGMYGETPRVRVGKFIICRQDDKSIWIEEEGKDGGAFSEARFEAAIKKFYDESF